MGMIDAIRQILAEEYGISSDDELIEALGRQKSLEIGLFVSKCGREELHDAKATS